MSTIVFKYFASIIRTVFTPAMAPTKVNGARNFMILKSTFPEVINLMELESDANVDENLLVPKAMWGDTPANKKAGTLIIPPPPAIESTKAATKPARHRKSIFMDI